MSAPPTPISQKSENSQRSVADCLLCRKTSADAGGDGANPSDQRNQGVHTTQPGAPPAGASSSSTVPPGVGDASSQEARQETSSEAREPIPHELRVQPKPTRSPLSAAAVAMMDATQRHVADDSTYSDPSSSPTLPPAVGGASSQNARQAPSGALSMNPTHSGLAAGDNSSANPIPDNSDTSNTPAVLPALAPDPPRHEFTLRAPQEPQASSEGMSASAQKVMESQDPKDAQEQQKEATEDGTSSKKEDDNLQKEEPRESKPGDDEEPIETARHEEHEELRSPVRLPRGVEILDEIPKLKEMIRSKEYDLTHPFWDKISLFYGDITKIQVDAIVNAANSGLYGGGGVDGAIHNAAGERLLKAETKKCERPVATGDAVITTACNLSTHVKNIIHCVGPTCYGAVTQAKRDQLVSCYRRAFELSEENGLRSIAFCCISTGIYGYDNLDAAKSVIKFLYKYFSKAENVEKWDRVVLCLFMDVDKECYKRVITRLVKDNTIFDEEETMSEDEDEDEEKDKKKKLKKEDEDKDDNMEEEEGEEKKKKDDKTEEKKKENEEKDVEESKKEDGKKCDKTEESGNNEKKEDDVSQTEKDTVDGDEQKKEEAPAPSSSSR